MHTFLNISLLIAFCRADGVAGSPSRYWFKLVFFGGSFCWFCALLLALRPSLGGGGGREPARDAEFFLLLAEPSVFGAQLLRVSYERGAGAGAEGQYLRKVKTSPAVNVPEFDEEGLSFQGYEPQVRL